MTGIYSLGTLQVPSCTYDSDRHNQIAQVPVCLPRGAYFKYEMKLSGSTGSFDSNFVPLGINFCEREGRAHRRTGPGLGGPLSSLSEKLESGL
jgi:hypothetical protein